MTNNLALEVKKMQKGIQNGLLLFMTVIFAVTISGFVSATDINEYSIDKSTQCQFSHQNSDINNYYSKISKEQKCQPNPTVCNDRKKFDETKCDKPKHAEAKCVPPKVKYPKKCKSTIGDRVWNDSNANGIQDQEEKGIENVTVNLWKGNTSEPVEKIATTKTDSSGIYCFTNLVKGIYWLEFILPTGTGEIWQFSPQNQGTDDSVDSDPNASGIAGPIDLIKCIIDPSWDAGLVFIPAAAGGEEEPPAAIDENGEAAAGEEFPVAAFGEEPVVAAAGEEVPMQEAGLPLGMLVMAVLMVLAGLALPKRK